MPRATIIKTSTNMIIMTTTRLIHSAILLYMSICVNKIEFSNGFATCQKLQIRSAHPGGKHASQSPLFLSRIRLEMNKKKDTVGEDPSVDGAGKANDEDGSSLSPKTLRPINQRKKEEMKPFLDPGLLIADFLAITLACQLTGLLDVINNPEFIQAGGWFQPIPMVPPTLGALVQHIAYVSTLWVGAVAITTAATATGTPFSRKNSESRNDNAASASMLTLLQQLLLFGILRMAVGVAISQVTPFAWTDWTGIIRDVYVVGLFLFALRFLYGQYFF